MPACAARVHRIAPPVTVGVVREGCTDSISLRPLGWSAPPWHAASDGAGCTAELGFGAPGPRDSLYSQVTTHLTKCYLCRLNTSRVI